MTTSTDRIEKQVVLRAPRERVWRAISDAKQFGTWFGVEFDGPFVAGAQMTGRITPTKVDPAVGKMQEPYAGKTFDCTIDRIEPMRLFSFRWHPFAIDPEVDYSGEPTTLVVFELEEVADGTRVTITESGFDRIPLERRARAFGANSEGWAKQTELLAKYLAGCRASLSVISSRRSMFPAGRCRCSPRSATVGWRSSPGCVRPVRSRSRLTEGTASRGERNLHALARTPAGPEQALRPRADLGLETRRLAERAATSIRSGALGRAIDRLRALVETIEPALRARGERPGCDRGRGSRHG
jgi:uncharacterized protein YndB with AHSA1/START domain